MAPGQKAAQDALFKPKKYTNEPPPYHPDAYKKAGMQVPPELQQHQQKDGEESLFDDENMDDFGQKAEMNGNDQSNNTIKSFNPDDINQND